LGLSSISAFVFMVVILLIVIRWKIVSASSSIQKTPHQANGVHAWRFVPPFCRSWEFLPIVGTVCAVNVTDSVQTLSILSSYCFEAQRASVHPPGTCIFAQPYLDVTLWCGLGGDYIAFPNLVILGSIVFVVAAVANAVAAAIAAAAVVVDVLIWTVTTCRSSSSSRRSTSRISPSSSIPQTPNKANSIELGDPLQGMLVG
jgi:hypothetical protein